MLSKELIEKVMEEKDLDKALKMLEPYKNEKWDEKVIKHLQQITPDEEDSIGDFSYRRKNK